MTGQDGGSHALLDRSGGFEVPYAAITSLWVYPHPARLGMMDVLDVCYDEGAVAREKSVCTYRDRIRRAWEIVCRYRPDLARLTDTT